jgi:restriction system protein
VAFQTPKPDSQQDAQAVLPATGSEIQELAVTPEEAVQQAEVQIFQILSSQLRIGELSPSFFERLVVDLIVSMGYGGSRDSVVQRLGKSGDEGIDGVVNEDPLGLDVVYIQAKRYAVENTIGSRRLERCVRDNEHVHKRSD